MSRLRFKESLSISREKEGSVKVRRWDIPISMQVNTAVFAPPARRHSPWLSSRPQGMFRIVEVYRIFSHWITSKQSLNLSQPLVLLRSRDWEPVLGS